MSSASQQFTASSGATYEHTDYNGEIGNIITHINNIYAFIDDDTGTSPLTVDTSNDRLGINITAPLSELHVADAAGSVEGRFDSTITGTTYGLYMGADSNEPYIGARTNHKIRIVSNSLTVAAFDTSYNLRLYAADGAGTYSTITTDASDNLTFDCAGSGIVQVSSGQDFGIRAGKALRVYSPGDSNYSTIYNDASDNLILAPNANGDLIVFGKHPRSNSGSTTYQNVHIQSGWGYVAGDGTAHISKAVTFPVAFSSSAVRVIISFIGYGGPTPTSEAYFGNWATGIICQSNSVSTTGFTAEVQGLVAGMTVGLSFGFSWIAIGPL